MPPQSFNTVAAPPTATIDEEFAAITDLLVERPEADAERTPGEIAFGNSMSELAERMPEVAEQQDTIRQYGGELVRDFGVHPEVFDNPANTMFLSALAQRLTALENGREDMSRDAYIGEKTFIANTTVLLAGRRSDHFPEYKDLLSIEDTISDVEYGKTLDRFTNKEVTADLQTAIDNGLLAEVQQRLGITEDNEDPFVLHVLNVGEQRVLHGMMPVSQNSVEMTSEQRSEEVADIKLYEGYTADLAKQSEAFKQQIGMTEIPIAWAVRLDDGSRHFSIALPTAEKLLYGDQKRSFTYSTQDLAQEKAIVEHEYAHTQGTSMCPDGNIAFGLSFEERRAEQMANNKMGYQDAKGFIDIDLQALTGINVTQEVITGTEKGGDGQKFWVAYARALGLQAALEVALAIPDSYVRNEYPLQKEVNEYLGGYNGVEQRLYENASPARQAQIDQSIASWADMVRDNPTNTGWRNTRRKLFNLRYVTNKLEAAINRENTAETAA
jgi:hypothetical protein